MMARPTVKKDPPLVLHNGITEDAWLTRFPNPYCVFALTPWEAHRLDLDPGKTWWQFLEDFAYVSDRFGKITIPKGFLTDTASIPTQLRSFIDNDSPEMLFPSAPHDRLFFSRGKMDNGKVLTFSECNQLMTEAMWWMGAGRRTIGKVYTAIQLGGKKYWDAPNNEKIINP